MFHDDLRDNDEYWLWGHVNRIKRSMFNFFDSDEEEQPKEEVIEVEEQPKKVHSTHKKQHKKSHKKDKRKDDGEQRHHHVNHHAGHEATPIDTTREEKVFLVPRLKRQFDDEDDDEPENGWSIVEENEVGSGSHNFDISKHEYASKPHQLCKYSLFNKIVKLLVQFSYL